MYRLKALTFVSALSFCAVVAALAQNNNAPQVPEGMEVIQIGGSGQLIVPKGAKTRKVGAQIIVEGTKEYMSRRFEEMEERFAKIEEAQDELKKQVKAIQDKKIEEHLAQIENALAELKKQMEGLQEKIDSVPQGDPSRQGGAVKQKAPGPVAAP